MDCAYNLTDNEINRIESYIQKNLMEKLNDYKNIIYNTKIIGSILVEKDNDIYLWVYKNNINAYKLYLKLGFNVFDETDTRYKMKYTIS